MASTRDIAEHTLSFYGGDFGRYQRAVGQVVTTGVVKETPDPAPQAERSWNGLVTWTP